MAFIQGYRGVVKIKNFSLHCLRWQASVHATQVDVTNFVYFGNAAYAASLKEADFTFDCIYDTADEPFAVAGTNIRVGTFGSCVLKLDSTNVTTAQWTFPNIVILSVRHTQQIRDVSRYSLTAKVSVQQAADVPTLPSA